MLWNPIVWYLAVKTSWKWYFNSMLLTVKSQNMHCQWYEFYVKKNPCVFILIYLLLRGTLHLNLGVPNRTRIAFAKLRCKHTPLCPEFFPGRRKLSMPFPRVQRATLGMWRPSAGQAQPSCTGEGTECECRCTGEVGRWRQTGHGLRNKRPKIYVISLFGERLNLQ